MKKFVLSALTIIGCLSFTNAQSIADNAIGLRLGDSDGLGAEISYQRALGDNNRLELDLGWRTGNDFDGFKLTGLYQWVWNIDSGFNWYAGAGGGVGAYDFEAPINDSETFFFFAGDVGIEYDFDIPLLLSLDFRPEIGFGDLNDDTNFDIALSIRYQF